MRAALAGSKTLTMFETTSQESGGLADRPAGDSARLVEAIAAGDREAEREFAERYQPRVRAMLTARTRNSDHAADLVQDVLIEAICALRKSQLRESAKLTAFVLGIARNVLNGHFRSSARQPEGLEFPDELPDLTSNALKLEEQQREATAMRAISSLDLVDRTILQLTLVEGLKPGIIAQRLNLNPDVVRQRKLRATRRVMDFVQGQSQNRFTVHMATEHKR